MLQERIKVLNRKGITTKVIADKARINKGTLYHFISNQQTISKEKQERLLQAVEELERLIVNDTTD